MKTPLSALTLLALSAAASSAAVVWQVGIDNNTQFHVPGPNAGTGGGLQANFIQELGGTNALPGNPANTGGTGGGRDIDDDYYFAGVYSTVLDGSGYSPVGPVAANEENVERAHTGSDPELRFHFNLPTTIGPDLGMRVQFDYYTMDTNGLAASDPSLFWDVEVLFNGVSVGTFDVSRTYIDGVLNPGLSELITAPFTLSDVGAVTGPGNDNYVTLRATNVGSNSRWMSLDYVSLTIPEPSRAVFLLMGALSAACFIRRRR